MNSTNTNADLHARALEITAMAKEFGFMIHAHGQIVSVSGRFTPGDKAAYVEMENNAYKILGKFKQTRAGSVWGSDSGSVGGAVALEQGRFVMNKSGCEKRLTSKFYHL